jgi:sugar O-acyltransferase (sialic acid O-acetyltransferase NeuD family)
MECKELVILGAGGLGREVLFQLIDINSKTHSYNILGFVDNTPELKGRTINNFPVLGDNSWLMDYPDKINVVVCIGNSRIRRRVVEEISQNEKVIFPNIIANNVKYSDTVKMGKGCIICFSSVLTVNISIGDFVIINLDCTVGHDASLGDFVTLYPSVNVSGSVSIGRCTEIGTGSNIIQHKTIGDNSIIGAGAVVVRDIPSDCTAVGVPAKPIK